MQCIQAPATAMQLGDSERKGGPNFKTNFNNKAFRCSPRMCAYRLTCRIDSRVFSPS